MRAADIAAIVLGSWCLACVPTAQAFSLPDMLSGLEDAYQNDEETNAKRLETFRNTVSEQNKMLAEVTQQLRAAEKNSATLEQRFAQNEKKISELEILLNRHLGTTGAIFGILKQVAGDMRSRFQDSLLNEQHPERVRFLSTLIEKMGHPGQLASVEDMETLWGEISREMLESGEVERLTADVVLADGTSLPQTVLRIGIFNIISDGEYLRHDPKNNRYVKLDRQPGGGMPTLARELQNADSGLLPFAIDPLRGQLLSALVQEPDLLERIQQGGIIAYMIIALGFVALLVALARLLVLSINTVHLRRQMKNFHETGDNALGRIVRVYHQHRDFDVEALELKLNEAILAETPRFNSGLLFLKIVAIIAPLLGLLGTVTGMIVTFQAISLFGTGEPEYMASGISQALVTTVLGLGVAIPVILLHTLLSSRSQSLAQILEEQSMGMLATHAAGK